MSEDDDLLAIREFIRVSLGMNFERKNDSLDRRLRTRLDALGCQDFAAYRRYIATEPHRSAELREIASIVTNNETYFFRERGQIRVFATEIVEDILRRPGRGSNTPLRIWSAACSSGEEPYSLVMSLLDAHVATEHSVSITATDISEKALEAARKGEYRRLSFRCTEPEIIARYFRPTTEDTFVIDDRVKRMVRFMSLNLVDTEHVARQGPFDVIFCRNALIYFRREVQIKVISALARALSPDGYLFLGHAESMFDLTDRFTPVFMRDAVVHRLREAASASLGGLR